MSHNFEDVFRRIEVGDLSHSFFGKSADRVVGEVDEFAFLQPACQTSPAVLDPLPLEPAEGRRAEHVEANGAPEHKKIRRKEKERRGTFA